jgi:hypothetical protein
MRKILAVLLLPAFLSPASAAATGRPVAAMPLVRHWAVYQDPAEHAFQLEMPQGWKLSGGTARHSALQYRHWASALSPNGAGIIQINDPNEPTYIPPSQLLATSGFRVGSTYNAGAGNTYIVAPYQSGVQFAASWGQRRFASYCTAPRLASSRARPELAQQMNSLARTIGMRYDYGEATFTCQRNGIDYTGYVCARTLLAQSGGPAGLWLADSIQGFFAPTRVSGLAAGVLAHMVKSFRVDQAWAERQSRTTMEVSRINSQANEAISSTIMGVWENRGAVIDRVMDEGSRDRLGIDIYSDPATGDEYTVGNTSRYYWTDPHGDIVGTDTADPPGPGYRQLNRVPPR